MVFHKLLHYLQKSDQNNVSQMMISKTQSDLPTIEAESALIVKTQFKIGSLDDPKLLLCLLVDWKHKFGNGETRCKL